jgi:hypothetical protein
MAVTISGSTGIAGVDGSAGTPAVQGADSNTGMFFPAADTIAFAEGGAEVMRIDSVGEVTRFNTNPGGFTIKRTDGVNSNGWLNFVGSDDVVDGSVRMATDVANALTFQTAATERARIDSSGNLLVGTTTASAQFHLSNSGGGGTEVMRITTAGGQTASFYYPSNGLSGTGPSATSTVQRIWRDASTARSINAAGTVNASGADYAEYMTKTGDFTVAKGDVVGVSAEGFLTNVFENAVSFVVKSTNPSYVGNDGWGVNLDGDQLEAARQKVDRIAFAGQVPVNVTGATPGQYIVPVDDNGGIKGVAKNEADMTLAEYMKAVGKVIAVEADGRAKIIVKVA